MTENDIKASIIEYLQYKGFLILRINSGAIRASYTNKRGETKQRFYWLVKWFRLGREPSSAGVSDLQAFKAGYPPLAIETKRPGKQATEAQQTFLNEWRQHGGVGIVASDVSDVQAVIESELE